MTKPTIDDLPTLLRTVENAERAAREDESKVSYYELDWQDEAALAAETKAKCSQTSDPVEWARLMQLHKMHAANVVSQKQNQDYRAKTAAEHRAVAAKARKEIERLRHITGNSVSVNAEDVRNVLRPIVTSGDAGYVRYLLRRYGNGAKSVTELNPKFYTKVIERATRVRA
jgi:hypothetical protein